MDKNGALSFPTFAHLPEVSNVAVLQSLPVLMDLGLGFLFSVPASTSHAGGFQRQRVPTSPF